MLSRRFEPHLRRTIAELEHRRSVLLEALRRHAGERVVVQGGQAGTHLAWQSQVPRPIELWLARSLGLYPMHPYSRNIQA